MIFYCRKMQKMLLSVAFIGCIITAVKIYMFVKPYHTTQTFYFDVEIMSQNISKVFNSRSDHPTNPIISKISSTFRSDVYELNGDVRIHGISSTIFVASSHDSNSTPLTTKPYPRKKSFNAVFGVKPFTIITAAADEMPRCGRRHTDIPAILFSNGKLAGNTFHAFTDVVVPLFMTAQRFDRSVILLVSNYTSEWTSKYSVITDKLSEYNLHDIDNEHEVLCFTRMIVGLVAHQDLEFVPSRKNFLELLQLQREVGDININNYKPRMLIISREKNRRLMNERETADMAGGLGFEVVVQEMYENVSRNALFVNSFDVMVGVHGAGLSNMIFLRENAVVIQIVPFGLKYYALICFEVSMESNRLKYLSYNVSLSESSLLGKYPPNSTIYTNPSQVMKNFGVFSSVYLDNQDVNLDLNRFRGTLLRALELLRT